MITIYHPFENTSEGYLVHYTSWYWDLWNEPSDCDWIVPGTLNVGAE